MAVLPVAARHREHAHYPTAAAKRLIFRGLRCGSETSAMSGDLWPPQPTIVDLRRRRRPQMPETDSEVATACAAPPTHLNPPLRSPAVRVLDRNTPNSKAANPILERF